MHGDETMRYRLTLVVTTACNLACDYCYVKRREPLVLSRDHAAIAVEFALSQLAGGDTLEVGWFGGEPLLAGESIVAMQPLIEDRCREHGVELETSLVTNGTLLTPDWHDWCREHRVDLLVSLDGPAEVHDRHRRFANGRGSYDEVVGRLEALPGGGRDLTLQMVITPANCDRIASGLDRMIDHGFRRFVTSIDETADWTPAALDRLDGAIAGMGDVFVRAMAADLPVLVSGLEEKIRRLAMPIDYSCLVCTFGRHELCVRPDGGLIGCERLLGLAPDHPLVLGQVEQLVTLEGRTLLAERVARLPSARRPDVRCQSCSDRAFCTWYCACVNFHRTGSTDRVDATICRMQRAWIATARRTAARVLGDIDAPEHWLPDGARDGARRSRSDLGPDGGSVGGGDGVA